MDDFIAEINANIEDYDNGQHLGKKLAKKYYHTILPNEIDFAVPARKILLHYLTEYELLAKSASWLEGFYQGFLARCIKEKLGDIWEHAEFLYQSEPPEEELQNYNQEWEL
ncbi:MAG: hypothetical protein KDJ65_31245 [Anaerolineae bacterium]|nr:hypothetical protein [Anaerolineae bacterium]